MPSATIFSRPRARMPWTARPPRPLGGAGSRGSPAPITAAVLRRSRPASRRRPRLLRGIGTAQELPPARRAAAPAVPIPPVASGAGGHPRACRKSVLGPCRREGVAVCDPGAGGLGRRKKSTTTTTTTTTQPPITTTTVTSATTTTLAGGGGSPATGLHYAPNHNL